MKCFKNALINGADPSKKSIYIKSFKKREIWNGYGFAGATGNIQMIKMIEYQGIPINGDLIRGITKFHQNHIFQWAEKEYKTFIKDGFKESIHFDNFEVFHTITQNYDISLLISKGAKKSFIFDENDITSLENLGSEIQSILKEKDISFFHKVSSDFNINNSFPKSIASNIKELIKEYPLISLKFAQISDNPD